MPTEFLVRSDQICQTPPAGQNLASSWKTPHQDWLLPASLSQLQHCLAYRRQRDHPAPRPVPQANRQGPILFVLIQRGSDGSPGHPHHARKLPDADQHLPAGFRQNLCAHPGKIRRPAFCPGRAECDRLYRQ